MNSDAGPFQSHHSHTFSSREPHLCLCWDQCRASGLNVGTVRIFVKAYGLLFSVKLREDGHHKPSVLKVCLPSKSLFSASKWGRTRGQYHEMLANTQAANTHKALFRRLSSLATRFTRVAYLSATEREQWWQPPYDYKLCRLILRRQSNRASLCCCLQQRLPIIRLGKAGCLLLLILIKMNIQ